MSSELHEHKLSAVYFRTAWTQAVSCVLQNNMNTGCQLCTSEQHEHRLSDVYFRTTWTQAVSCVLQNNMNTGCQLCTSYLVLIWNLFVLKHGWFWLAFKKMGCCI